ncbi:MAG: cardiolipin synthase [Alloprevotella sp.]|nr:cardiolipin synthase [Alloprevotella sp.]
MSAHTFYIILLVSYVLLVMSTATVVVLENRQPAKTIAWLIVLAGIPVVGLVFFYFFGQDERRRHALNRGHYLSIAREMHADVAGTTQEAAVLPTPARYVSLSQMLEHQGVMPVTGGNRMQPLETGRDFLDSLLAAIADARDHVHIETYIIEDDAVGRRVRDALVECVARGVEVRLLYDDVGCWNVPQRFFRPLEEAGVLVGTFLPVRFPKLTRRMNYRDHRKLCVVDGTIGFIGGMNLAERYVTCSNGLWQDMHMSVEGPAVAAMQRAFLSNWHFATGRLRLEKRFFPAVAPHAEDVKMQIVTSSPLSGFPEIMFATTWLAQNARRYLYMQTPYFMPTDSVLQALQTAAMAGADVRLMLPKKPDAFWLRWANDGYFVDVLSAGIRIFLYDEGFLHAKTLVMDDECLSIGSANMDFRSYENNFEANAIVYDREMAVRLRDHFLRLQADCHEVSLEEWGQRPLWRKYLESHTRILSPLL